MAKLNEGISIQQLINGGVEFEVKMNDCDYNAHENSIEKENDNIEDSLLEFTNMNCIQGEDGYSEGEPFELISKQMTNLIPNGGVKKKILKAGYGELPPDLAVVKVDYNGYIEYDATPFDSTYSRKKKHEFVINNSEVILGLDIAVQSMRITEKSQFLIMPQYAYGVLGCLGRVPKNSTVLFEVELHEIVDSGAALSYNKLSEEKKLQFEQIYNYCLAICARAKDKFQKNVRDAVKEYNTAANKLEHVQLKDYCDQEKQQDLLLRLYTNILVCYTKLEEPKRGCSAANKIYEASKSVHIKIPAKVYFSNAKCLRMLGDFTQARKRLEMAQRMEPRNPDIANEFILLKEDMDKYKQRENQMAKAFLVKPDSNIRLQ